MGQIAVPSIFLLKEQHESTDRTLTITLLVVKYKLTVCSFAGQIILKSAFRPTGTFQSCRWTLILLVQSVWFSSSF